MSKPWKTTCRVSKHTAGWGQHMRVRESFDANVEVTIDWQKLAQKLAEKAANNKSGRSAMMGGIIKAKITNEIPRLLDKPSTVDYSSDIKF